MTGRWAWSAHLHARFNGRRLELLARRQSRQAALDAGGLPDFLPETAAIRSGDWRVAPVPRDLEDRRVEITGPGRPQDDDQRAQLARAGLHGRLRGLLRADLGEHRPRPGEPARRRRPQHRVSRSRVGQGLPPQRQDRDPDRPSPRLAPAREARAGGRRAVSGSIFDFAVYLANNHASLAAHGTGPYFYLPKMESHLEARLWNDIFLAAQDWLGMRARHHQGHGADRDHPRRVRDGRDPLRAARAFGRPELRPLGLHLQLHQEIQEPPGLRAARPRHGDDGHGTS